jgi:hypothetical protein
MRINNVVIETMMVISIMFLALHIPIAYLGPATLDNFGLVWLYEDQLYNWDFSDTRVDISITDWPITIVFYENATKAKVAEALKSRGWSSWIPVSEMYALINDRDSYTGTNNWFWDKDKGLKKHERIPQSIMEIFARACNDPYLNSTWDRFIHIRLYANPDTGYIFSPWLGKYVIASTHPDDLYMIGPLPIAELWSGLPSYAEFKVRSAFNNVRVDAINLYNADWTCRVVGSHYNLNDGYATLIKIP